MRLKLFRPLWGVIQQADGHLTIPEALSRIAKLGYTGIECPILTPMMFGKKQFRELLDQHKLQYIAMVFTDGPVAPGAAGVAGHPKPGPSVQQHLDVFKKQVEEALEMNPYKINSHTGNDYMTFHEANLLLRDCLDFEKQIAASNKKAPIIMHETHRKRILHSPWVTREILPLHPTLKIVADYSHFTCVAETNPHDPVLTKTVASFASRVRHIHARVGYDHGPQVPDPRVPHWEPYVQGFEAWWQHIWKTQAAQGLEETSLSPEHGPPNYQIVDPNTKKPLADIWDVNTWLGEREKKAFDKLFSKS